MNAESPGLSILIPCHNEAGNIDILMNEIEEEVKKAGLQRYEVIWINDASNDGGFNNEKQFPLNHKVIANYRKMGQSLSLSVGVRESSFEFIGIIDGDCQNVPADLIRYLRIMVNDNKIDMIQGRRARRYDTRIRKIPSSVANLLTRKLTNSNFHDLGCGTKVMKKSVCTTVPFRGEIHRIYALHVYMSGFNVHEETALHRPRIYGRSKYGLKRIFKFIADVTFLRFKFAVSQKPIYVFGSIAIVMLISGVVMCGIAFLLRIFGVKDYLDGALVIGSLILFTGALLTTFLSFVLETILEKISVITNEIKK